MFRFMVVLGARAMLVAIAAGACSDGGGALEPDAGPPPGCERPPLDAPWVAPLLSDAVSRLAAAPRALPQQREAARAILADQLTAIGWSPQRHDYPDGANIHATIPANRGDGAAIIVGAHFDSVDGSPGANDNASGAAVVLALARYLAELPCREAPVTVVFFDQEEVGLFGARAFAQLFDAAAVRAVHTIDQVAWDADGDRTFEIERPTPALAAEWRAAATVVGATIAVTPTTGTDHDAFREAGFAAVGLTEEYVGGDTSPLRHQAGDTYESIEPYLPYLTLAARLTFQVISEAVAP